MADQSGATEFITHVSADEFVPEIWSASAVVSRENEHVFPGLVNRQFESELTFGDTIHVPTVGSLPTRTKTAETAIVYEQKDESNIDIVINQDEYVAIALERRARIQTNRNLLETYSPKMGIALGEAVDDKFATAVKSLSGSQGAVNTALTVAFILQSLVDLDDAKVPIEGRSFIFSPAEVNNIIQQEKFVSTDYSLIHGGNENARMMDRAPIASLRDGTPIYRSTNLEAPSQGGHNNVVFHRETWALVMQMSPTTYTMWDIDFFADKVAMNQLYGLKEMRDDHGVWLKGA